MEKKNPNKLENSTGGLHDSEKKKKIMCTLITAKPGGR